MKYKIQKNLYTLIPLYPYSQQPMNQSTNELLLFLHFQALQFIRNTGNIFQLES
jgi:hypothetical protein